MHGRSDKIRLSTGDDAAGAALPGEDGAGEAGEGSAAGPPGPAGDPPGGTGERLPWDAGAGDDDEAWRCAARPGGYAWWYVDVSDERYTLTVILFAGGVFSPAYAARVRGGADDSGLLHPAVHAVLLDGDRTRAWVMNEYDPGCLERLPGGIRVAGSSLRRERDGSVGVDAQQYQP